MGCITDLLSHSLNLNEQIRYIRCVAAGLHCLSTCAGLPTDYEC